MTAQARWHSGTGGDSMGTQHRLVPVLGRAGPVAASHHGYKCQRGAQACSQLPEVPEVPESLWCGSHKESPQQTCQGPGALVPQLAAHPAHPMHRVFLLHVESFFQYFALSLWALSRLISVLKTKKLTL